MAETGYLSIQDLLRVLNECTYVDENGNRYLRVLGKDDEVTKQPSTEKGDTTTK